MATDINYCPQLANDATSSRRYKVPDMWGKIRMDWISNHALAKRHEGESSQISEDSKNLLTPCSVKIKRCKPSSSSLVWDVQKIKLEDQTVQLLYHGVRVRDRAQGEEVEIPEINENNSKEFHQHKCPTCGQWFGFKDNSNLRSHVMSHYYHLFFKVLPASKPFPCPICGKVNRDRCTLARHYAFTHEKIFDMTDLSPGDLPVIAKWRETDDQTKYYKCPICGYYVRDTSNTCLRFHILTHFYQVFFEVLPKRKPFSCPICGKISRNKISLARHYAFLHKKIFEVTDLSHETLYYSKSSVRKFEQKHTEPEEQRLQQIEYVGDIRVESAGSDEQVKMKVEQEEEKVLYYEAVPIVTEGP